LTYLEKEVSHMNVIQKLFSKQKKVKIEFCQRNLEQFLKEENYSEYNEFLSRKNVDYKEFECQSRCKECRLSPYAMVDGEFVIANNSGELLKKMAQYLD
jgi:uncharacterized protein YuzB (UPF0349 family)